MFYLDLENIEGIFIFFLISIILFQTA